MTPDMLNPHALLQLWLKRQLPAPAWQWVSTQVQQISLATDDRLLYQAISQAPRNIGKSELRLSEQDLQFAGASRSAWRPQGWSLVQAARIFILLSHRSDSSSFAHQLKQLCITADVQELITFYQGLPLYPGASSLLDCAREGVRSNIKTVFEAVAHHNPYPSENFPEDSWNQMVLKAIFIDSPLEPIQGLHVRRNENLTRTLIDYIHERWAASRPVSPELWQLLGPFAREASLSALQRPLKSNNLVERQAATLALREYSVFSGKAKVILSKTTEFDSDIAAGLISWQSIQASTPRL